MRDLVTSLKSPQIGTWTQNDLQFALNNSKLLEILGDTLDICLLYVWNFLALLIMTTKSYCHNPTLRECEDETHIPEMGTWESFGTLKTLEFDCKGQNTLHWGVLYIVGKLSKCRCQKWACWAIWTYTTHVMVKRRVGSQTGNLIPNH
jgi:hypothetical protein